MISQTRLAQLNGLIQHGKAGYFYDWPEWKAVRDDVLRMDNYECQLCKARGRHSKAIIVHHVNHLKDRPDLALSVWDGQDRQLVSVCRKCHEELHPERAMQPRAGRKPVTQERWD